VTDDGRAGGGTAAAPGAGAGGASGAGTRTGLLGLAERLRFHGGTLAAGRRPGGGFRVSARIPLPAPAGRDPAGSRT
jgi:signal transduction histidine kinase